MELDYGRIKEAAEGYKKEMTAFLRAMLYGLPTRDRGALADKNRYNPWSGSPMQGTLDISAGEYGDISLRRETARADSPMGRFSATYSGTGDEEARNDLLLHEQRSGHPVEIQQCCEPVLKKPFQKAYCLLRIVNGE